MAELNGKYINEESHKKGKKFFKTLGIILACAAAALLITGVALVATGISIGGSVGMDNEAWFDISTKGSLLSVVGFAIGGFAQSYLHGNHYWVL